MKRENPMLVSIVIPTYNRKVLLERAIQSVLKQTYQNIEIIIIDDGSTDGTREYMSHYLRKYQNIIKYYYKENGGVSSARNFGIRKAKGEYISFLDSDDIIYPEKINKQMQALSSYQADVCYCSYHLVDKNKRTLYRMNYKKGDILLKYLENKIIPNTNTWLIRKNIILDNKIFFREGCDWGEDMEFFVKILYYSKICYVPEALLACYIHGEGRLSDFSLDKIQKDIFIWTEINKWLEKKIEKDFLKLRINKVIFQYRIPALIIYRLYSCKSDIKKVKKIYKDNKEFIKNIGFCNGMRSLKLFFYYGLLILRIRNI